MKAFQNCSTSPQLPDLSAESWIHACCYQTWWTFLSAVWTASAIQVCTVAQQKGDTSGCESFYFEMFSGNSVLNMIVTCSPWFSWKWSSLPTWSCLHHICHIVFTGQFSISICYHIPCCKLFSCLYITSIAHLPMNVADPEVSPVLFLLRIFLGVFPFSWCKGLRAEDVVETNSL